MLKNKMDDKPVRKPGESEFSFEMRLFEWEDKKIQEALLKKVKLHYLSNKLPLIK